MIRSRFVRRGVAAGLLLGGLALGPAQAGARSVEARVEGAVRAHRAKNRVAVGVWNAETGEALFRHRADELLRPASVMKLWTTGAALLTLGPDHELATEVALEGRVGEGGVLAGNLWVRGEGDPGMSGRFHDGDVEVPLRRLARAVRAAGVKRVRGDLVLDARAIPDPGRPEVWEWEDGDHAWYGAPISALTLNDGCIDVTVGPGAKVGAPAVVKVAPLGSGVEIQNRLVTVAAKKEHVIAFGPRAGDRVRASGKVWKRSGGYTASLACVDPLPFFGRVFLRALSAAGVIVSGNVRSPLAGEDPDLRRVGRRATSVRRVVHVINTSSQNLYSELLLRAVGRHALGDGSAEAGIRRVRDALRVAAADRSVHQVDGSGLARSNAVSADAAGNVLVRMYASEHRLAFMQSLAKPGEAPGTLRKRFREQRFAGRLLAKTGTLRDTTALAGYVRAPGGTVYAFAVLVEGDKTTGKRLQKAVVNALVEE